MAETARAPVERESADPTAARAEQLKALFPEAFADGRLDPDRLRAALGEVVTAGAERFGFTWAGRSDAAACLQVPTRATLVPCPEESLDWDATRNVYIEGDNLEVLKLLYKPYHGRVKLIYIDPPYNTGNDFIYPDDFRDTLANYLDLIGELDADGNRLRSKRFTNNSENSGRYHSDWLSMMYPRLFLARQLLRDDGVIFVSIDDHEVHHLRVLMDEVFGEENFVAKLVRKRRLSSGMGDNPISTDHEYVVAYARQLKMLSLFGTLQNEDDYPFQDVLSKYRSTDLTVGMTRSMRPNQHYPIKCPDTKTEYWPAENRVWRFDRNTMLAETNAGNIIWPESNGSQKLSRPRYKTRFKPDGTARPIPVSTWIESKRNKATADGSEADTLNAGLNQEATKELQDLFDTQLLEYPKPVSLVSALARLGSRHNDIVLDFFSGSGTTAHAVLELNREDGGNRRFILVQLPEPTGNKQYPTIAEIGKERIRRVVARQKSQTGTLWGGGRTF